MWISLGEEWVREYNLSSSTNVTPQFFNQQKTFYVFMNSDSKKEPFC